MPMLRHSRRAFVETLDFLTSAGHCRGDESRREFGLTTRGPVQVITDLGILAPDTVSKELVLTHVHPGVTVDQVLEATGWELNLAAGLAETPPPQAGELAVLRDLRARTRQAHRGESGG